MAVVPAARSVKTAAPAPLRSQFNAVRGALVATISWTAINVSGICSPPARSSSPVLLRRLHHEMVSA